MSLRRIGVVGAGNMGSGIAQKTATEGFDVVLVDVDLAAANAGLARIRSLLAEGVERKIFRPEAAEAIAARVRPSGDVTDLAGCDLVVEAVFEDLAVKRDLFAQLDRAAPPHAILATNTSSFRVQDVAEATRRPDRVVGLHYFYHPAKNRLVEVIAGPRTSPETFGAAWSFGEATGKTPIRSADSPGFVVNRFFVPWANEAVRLLEEGAADIPTIEASAKRTFGIGMGPFELMNVTGVPIALHAATTLGERLGPFYAPSSRLARQVASAKPWELPGAADERRAEIVRRRLLGVTFLVSAALVEEGVGSIEDVDIGARVGLRWAAGPFELANRDGPAQALALAREAAERFGLPVPRLLADHGASMRPFEFRLVRLSVSGGIAEILLDRPDALNALNEDLVAQLARAFDEAERRADVRTIVLRGAGKAFVAGADVKFFVQSLEAGDRERIRAFTERARELWRRIDRSRKLVICRLDGLSLGGGSELALCCDVILATEKGSLGFPETGIGIYPGLGGTQRTTRRIGVPLARWLVLTGSPVDARTAEAIGLVDEVVPLERMGQRIRELHGGTGPSRRPRELPAEIQEIARFFAEADVEALLRGAVEAPAPRVAREAAKVRHKAPIASRIADRLIREGAARSLDEALDMELAALDEVLATRDALEGLQSVGVGRPQFQGR